MEETKDEYNQDDVIIPHDLTESNLGQTNNSINPTNVIISDIENQNQDQESARKIYELTQFKITVGIILAVMIIMYTSFIVCDIYFALNDNSCVNQDVTRLSFNLKTFLLVRGFILLGLIFDVILTLCFTTHSMIGFCTFGQISIFVMICIFSLTWNIIRAVLFWGYMDTSQCSNLVYNYTFASLVIAFVGSSINLLTRKSKDD